MPKIKQSSIDDLLAQVDLVDVVGRRVKLKKAGKEYTGLCPFHAESSASFTVSPTKQFYHCFGCGAHGNAIGFIQDNDGVDFRTAAETLAGEYAFQLAFEEDDRRQTSVASDFNPLYYVLTKASEYFYRQMKDSEETIGYLKKRGLTGQTVKAFSIGFAPDRYELDRHLGGHLNELETVGLLTKNEQGNLYNKFRSRVMFPIYSESGKVLGFGGRIMQEERKGLPKYLNSPESVVFHKGQELYGLFQAKEAIRKTRSALLLEGYMDVVMCHQYGETRAVAALGTSLTEAQLRKLFKLADEVLFCFDGDKAGTRARDRAALIALGELVDGKQVKFITLPDNHDPDSFLRDRGLAGWQDYLKEEAEPLSQRIMAMATADYQVTTVEGAAEVGKLAVEYLQMIRKAGHFKSALKSQFEKLLGFSLGDVPVGSSRVIPALVEEENESESIKQVAVQALFNQQHLPIYQLTAFIAALDRKAIEAIPAVDDFCDIISGWFQIAPPAFDERLLAMSQLNDANLKAVLEPALMSAFERIQVNASVENEVAGAMQSIRQLVTAATEKAAFENLFK